MNLNEEQLRKMIEQNPELKDSLDALIQNANTVEETEDTINLERDEVVKLLKPGFNIVSSAMAKKLSEVRK